MKRVTWGAAIAVVISGLFLIFQGCSLRQTEETKKFVITDQSSGRVLDTYEYDTASGNIQRVVIFSDTQQARSVTEFAHDGEGRLARTITQARSLTHVQTEVVDYSVTEEYDGQNRLIKTVQSGTDGNIVETMYGYDEQGRLRGVAQMLEDGTVVMMDYDYE
jgi:YD repeat-containing protein